MPSDPSEGKDKQPIGPTMGTSEDGDLSSQGQTSRPWNWPGLPRASETLMA